MRKLITLCIAVFAIFASHAQVAWDQINVRPVEYGVTGNGGSSMSHRLIDVDYDYLTVKARGGAWLGWMEREGDDATYLTGVDLATAKIDGDEEYSINESSIAAGEYLFRIIEGEPVGTSPRVRFMNVKTGNYVYIGTVESEGVDGEGNPITTSTIAIYMAPRNSDPNNGTKDLIVVDMGARTNGEYYYTIGADDPTRICNTAIPENGTYQDLSLKNSNGGECQWRFAVRWPEEDKDATEPSLKPALLPKLDVLMSVITAEDDIRASGNIEFDILATTEKTLTGTFKLYQNATLVSEITLADGSGTYTHEAGVIFGDQTYVLVYSGDENYEPTAISVPVVGGPDVNALETEVTLDFEETAEVHSDVVINMSVKDASNDPVGEGYINFYINDVLKNVLNVDVEGAATITIPNFTEGSYIVKAQYIGDKVTYLDSDAAEKGIDIIASSSDVKPYPVYFDLTQQYEFAKHDQLYRYAAGTDAYSVDFYKDSLQSITIENDTTGFVRYYVASTLSAITKISDQYANYNNLQVDLGSGRSKWINFKTPWLNEGAYNIYLSYRGSLDPNIPMTSVSMDEKESYFPEAELTGRWLRGWGGNNGRRWSAQTPPNNDNNMPARYIGSVNVESSNVHDLKIMLEDKNGIMVTMDMLFFIPVDQDSLQIGEASSVGLKKIYLPLFDLGGFPSDTARAATTYPTRGLMSIPYQVADATEYTKYSHTLDGLTNEAKLYDVTDGWATVPSNYVVVYRTDKWTRMAEGFTEDGVFTCELPAGEYFYQELFFAPNEDNVTGEPRLDQIGTRVVANEGTFTVQPNVSDFSPSASNIKISTGKQSLSVKGLEAGDRVMVVDVTGKMVLNQIAASSVIDRKMPQAGIYIVRVIGSDNLVRKVIVK